MNILSKISNWFKPEAESSIDNREYEWCIVGNIIDKHYWGEEKEVRRGSKHFGPGTKVYCLPEFGGMAHEDIRVIGKPRRQRRLINLVLRTRMIKNFRVQRVYSRKVQNDVGSHLYYWNNRRTSTELKNLKEMAKYLNTLTVEINE